MSIGNPIGEYFYVTYLLGVPVIPVPEAAHTNKN